MNGDDATILLTVYRQQLSNEQPKLEALQSESDGLPAKIDDDRKKIADLEAAEEEHRQRVKNSTRQEFEDRKQKRWDIMNNGTYGGYLGGGYPILLPGGGNVGQHFIGSFSPDGRRVIAKWISSNRTNGPEYDTPEMRAQIRALRDEAKEDLAAYMSSNLMGNFNFHRNLDRQISLLEERMRNEVEPL